jgi:PREDICTED: similar to tRNA-dihydrouridine synthase 2-like, partial
LIDLFDSSLFSIQLEQTLKLAEIIQSSGVAAITVHGRTKDERSGDPNHNDYIREISKTLNIPVIAK